MKELIERWIIILVGVFIPQRMNKRDKKINAILGSILVLIAIGVVVFVALAINFILGLGRAF